MLECGRVVQRQPYVHGVADPVDSGVAADDLVHRVDHDHLEVFVHRVLTGRGRAGWVRAFRVAGQKVEAHAADTIAHDTTRLP